MPERDYSYGKIYKIISEDTTDIYIGSTVQTLSMRMVGHRKIYNNWVKHNNKYCSSYEILKYGNAKIKLIKKYPCESKKELEREEGRCQLEFECVNRNIAGRTAKEYRQANKTRRKKYQKDNKIKLAEYYKKYQQNNKKKIQQINKKYRQNNKLKINENAKKYYQDNKLKIQQKDKKYYQDNKNKISEYHKKYYQDNKLKCQKRDKKYYQDNKNKCCCGSNFLDNPSQFKKHFNTKKHQKFISSFEHIPSHLLGEILDEFIIKI